MHLLIFINAYTYITGGEFSVVHCKKILLSVLLLASPLLLASCGKKNAEQSNITPNVETTIESGVEDNTSIENDENTANNEENTAESSTSPEAEATDAEATASTSATE